MGAQRQGWWESLIVCLFPLPGAVPVLQSRGAASPISFVMVLFELITLARLSWRLYTCRLLLCQLFSFHAP